MDRPARGSSPPPVPAPPAQDETANPGLIFVCAHGAGGHKDDSAMLALDRTLTGIGLEVVRFNFPYREKGRKIPDPMPVLKAAIAERASGRKAIIGGRSMGGRAASMLAA